MRGIHFSRRRLFGVVSFLAVGCGQLIYASPPLSKLAFTAVVTILLGAVSAAVYRSGNRLPDDRSFAVRDFVRAPWRRHHPAMLVASTNLFCGSTSRRVNTMTQRLQSSLWAWLLAVASAIPRNVKPSCSVEVP